MSNSNELIDMKKIKLHKIAAIMFAIASVNFFCYGQLEVVTNIPGGFPAGGYQGGIYGGGGEDTFKDIPAPRNLSAIGGDNEVFLTWDEPLPLGEVRYDDNSVESWYWLNNPTSNNDLFYTQFNAPVSGSVTNVAVLNGASSSATWDKIMICPDDGSGKPDLGSPWETFSSIAVTTSPAFGGEWSIMNLTTPQVVIHDEVFYIVTQWPSGSTTGPFVAADGDSNSGRCAYSINGGTTWINWPENIIMRAYMESDNNKSMELMSAKNAISGYVPVLNITNGKLYDFKPVNIAQSVVAPKIYSPNSLSSKGFTQYKIYRSTSTGGPYSFLDNAPVPNYTDNTAANGTLYFYVATAEYSDGESENSNESSAFPQDAESTPYSNNFDTNNGSFYGTIDWEWGVPNYAGGPALANSIPNVWGTNLSGDYNNLASSWLVLPFDLSEQVTYELSFAYWHALETGFDFGYLAIDHNYDGIFEIINTYNGTSGGWQNESLAIHDSLTTAYSRLAFIVVSDGSNTQAGLYVDDVEITRYIDLDITVFLEGPFNGSNMDTDLNTAGILPLIQPFNISPWNYPGTESVATIPDPGVLDWTLVELRDAVNASSATSGTMIARQAGFVKDDGGVTGLDGSSLLRFNNFPAITQNLFVVVMHRNHLGLITSGPVTLSTDKYEWDFSSSAGQAHNSGQKQLNPALWGMYGGDANADGTVNSADKTLWSNGAGTTSYILSDFNLDSQTNNNDKNDIWIDNEGVSSEIPN